MSGSEASINTMFQYPSFDSSFMFNSFVLLLIIFLVSFVYLLIELKNKRIESIEKENDSLKNEMKISKAESYLTELILKKRCEEIPGLTLNSLNMQDLDLNSVTISDAMCANAIDIVTSFNAPNQSPVIEKSRSIAHPRSVHCFMKNLIKCVKDAVSNNSLRICYEWSIRCPSSKRSNFIDFAIMKAHAADLNWLNYVNGIELKINPNANSHLKTSGPMAHDGIRQALSRSALCVSKRWEHAGKTGMHRACCCFADARRIGIARVTISSDVVVKVEVSESLDFPGYDGCQSIEALQLLVLVISSLNSEFVSSCDKVPAITNGVDTWYLGDTIGEGGFASVSAAPESNEYVIKTIGDDQYFKKLAHENEILQLLALKGVRDAPVVIDVMYQRENQKQVIALKLSRRGISVPEYVAACVAVRAAAAVTTTTAAAAAAAAAGKAAAAGSDDIPIDICISLIKVLGPVFAKVLQKSHSNSGGHHRICHCDVRPPNMLIIPQSDVMSDIVTRSKDFDLVVDYYHAIANIDLATCQYQLNDWGEAINNSTDEECRIDLKKMVSRFDEFRNRHDVTDVVSSRTPSSSSASSSFFTTTRVRTTETISLFNEEFFQSLNRLADRLDYDGLGQSLANLRIEQTATILRSGTSTSEF